MDGWKVKFPIGKVTVKGGTVNFGGVPLQKNWGFKVSILLKKHVMEKN